jgi:hypothetical protein
MIMNNSNRSLKLLCWFNTRRLAVSSFLSIHACYFVLSSTYAGGFAVSDLSSLRRAGGAEHRPATCTPRTSPSSSHHSISEAPSPKYFSPLDTGQAGSGWRAGPAHGGPGRLTIQDLGRAGAGRRPRSAVPARKFQPRGRVRHGIQGFAPPP